MKYSTKLAILVLVVLVIGGMLTTCVAPEIGGKKQAEDGITCMENLPGPIDDVIFIQTGEKTYQVTITLDNGYDFFTFDLDVNEGLPFTPSGDAMSA